MSSEDKIKDRFKNLFFLEMPDVVEIKANEAMVIALDMVIYEMLDVKDYLDSVENPNFLLHVKIDELKKRKAYYEDSNN